MQQDATSQPAAPAATPAPVLMVQFSAARLGDYQKMARDLRAAGIGVEVYPEAKKIGASVRLVRRQYQLRAERLRQRARPARSLSCC